MSSLSHDARQLLSLIAESRRTRWPLEELELKHLQTLPHMRGRPECRRDLAAIINELTAAGSVRASKRQDRSRMPALPAFVDVVRPRAPDNGRTTAREHGWRPELAAVLTLRPAPTPAEQRILRTVNRWLADRGDSAPPCGSHERSLEVFGDEKVLDERLRYGRLFATGLLSYELLRTRRIAPGLVTETVGDAPTALVVENSDTFRSIVDVLGEMTAPPVGLVAWGAGAAFEQTCETLLRLEVSGRPLQRAFYFGDVDPSGLRIPARAARLVAPFELRPARPLYTLLLNGDQRGKARERMGESTEEHLRWLGKPLTDWARLVMQDGCRLPQEALTAEVLRSFDEPMI